MTANYTAALPLRAALPVCRSMGLKMEQLKVGSRYPFSFWANKWSKPFIAAGAAAACKQYRLHAVRRDACTVCQHGCAPGACGSLPPAARSTLPMS